MTECKTGSWLKENHCEITHHSFIGTEIFCEIHYIFQFPALLGLLPLFLLKSHNVKIFLFPPIVLPL